MKALGSAFLAVLLGVAWLNAQVGEPLYVPYRNAVIAYQRGNLDAAARAINLRSIEDLHRVVQVALRERPGGSARDPAGFADEIIGGPTPEAAAMLHTEVVLRGLSTRTLPDSVHLELAEQLIRGMGRVRPRTTTIDRQEMVEFQQRWYVLAASRFLAATNPPAAQPWLDRGVALSRGDRQLTGAQAWLELTSGIAFELAAHLIDPECRRPSCDGGNPGSQRPDRLSFAAAAYQRALERDPFLVEARLRLGRVRYLRNSRQEAEAELRRALADATTVRQRYLAHLFLGELAQVEKDFSRARTEYEAARAEAPQFQTPHIAIGFVAQMSGDAAALKELSAAAARPGETDRDPWAGYQNGGLDEETFEWLRAKVAR